MDELSPAIPGFLLGIRDAIRIYDDQPDLQALLDFFAETTIPEARNYTPEQLKDMRFVQRLPKP